MATVRAIIYPPCCLLCDAPGDNALNLCAPCHADLPWNTHACLQCALPMTTTEASNICGQCLANPPAFQQATAPLCYASSVAWMIAGLKFRQQLGNARLLGQLLANALPLQTTGRPDLIMSVPLQPGRLRERGYNQALEIARPVARATSLAIDYRSLRRCKPTSPQSSLGLKARRKNLLGAFECRQNLAGKHIALIDDVMTSGSTLNAAALALKKAGAVQVSAWVAARAPLNAI